VRRKLGYRSVGSRTGSSGTQINKENETLGTSATAAASVTAEGLVRLRQEARQLVKKLRMDDVREQTDARLAPERRKLLLGVLLDTRIVVLLEPFATPSPLSGNTINFTYKNE
jgi:hypothetical protein